MSCFVPPFHTMLLFFPIWQWIFIILWKPLKWTNIFNSNVYVTHILCIYTTYDSVFLTNCSHSIKIWLCYNPIDWRSIQLIETRIFETEFICIACLLRCDKEFYTRNWSSSSLVSFFFPKNNRFPRSFISPLSVVCIYPLCMLHQTLFFSISYSMWLQTDGKIGFYNTKHLKIFSRAQ